MSKAFFMVRAVVADPADRPGFDTWYEKEHLPDALAALREPLQDYDAFTLAGLHVIASITGSLILALAVAEGYIPGVYAFELSRIDEAYQAEKWGEDAEAQKRTAALAHELDKAVELIAAVRQEGR
jgi:chaperone required for assembly of F1-ATPase